jgi:hypothetical protein
MHLLNVLCVLLKSKSDEETNILLLHYQQILFCFRFKATMQFYQYQPRGGANDDDVDPKDFFALWSPFCSDFKDIWKKEQQRLIKEK